MPIYLKIPGISGESTADGHKDWIECLSLQWGVGRGIHTQTGRGASRESSAPSISEVTIVKETDKGSPSIFQEACIGTAKDIEIHMCQTGDKLQTYMEFKLSETLISGYSMSSSGEKPSESVSFNFTKIEIKYTPYDPKRGPGSPIPAGYNIATGKKV